MFKLFIGILISGFGVSIIIEQEYNGGKFKPLYLGDDAILIGICIIMFSLYEIFKFYILNKNNINDLLCSSITAYVVLLWWILFILSPFLDEVLNQDFVLKILSILITIFSVFYFNKLLIKNKEKFKKT